MVIGGLQAVGAVANFMNQKAVSKYKRKLQAYNNKMVNISNAINQNAITNNLSTQMSKFARIAVDLEANKLGQVASAEVMAATAGVSGNSVDATIMDIQANAAGKEYNRQTELNSMLLATDQQSRQSNMSAKMGQNHNYIPKPNMIKSALDLGQSLYGMKTKAGASWGDFLKY